MTRFSFTGFEHHHSPRRPSRSGPKPLFDDLDLSGASDLSSDEHDRAHHAHRPYERDGFASSTENNLFSDTDPPFPRARRPSRTEQHFRFASPPRREPPPHRDRQGRHDHPGVRHVSARSASDRAQRGHRSDEEDHRRYVTRSPRPSFAFSQSFHEPNSFDAAFGGLPRPAAPPLPDARREKRSRFEEMYERGGGGGSGGGKGVYTPAYAEAGGAKGFVRGERERARERHRSPGARPFDGLEHIDEMLRKEKARVEKEREQRRRQRSPGARRPEEGFGTIEEMLRRQKEQEREQKARGDEKARGRREEPRRSFEWEERERREKERREERERKEKDQHQHQHRHRSPPASSRPFESAHTRFEPEFGRAGPRESAERGRHGAFRDEERPKYNTHEAKPSFCDNLKDDFDRASQVPEQPEARKPAKDPYKVLGVAQDAMPELIRSTYRKLSMKHHPDRAKEGEKEAATKKMAEINEANEILSDPVKRKRYDRTGKV